jgi:TatD DNase family protein
MIDFINIHTHQLVKDENTFSLYNIALPCKEIPEKIYLSAGWHPWDIEDYDLPQIDNSLNEIVALKYLLAIGECGLDRSIKISFEKQAEVFKLHLKTAKEHVKPLIIHCVRAYSDLLQMLMSENFNGKFILHNFNGNRYQIDSILKFDAYFSLGKQLLNPIPRFCESLKYIPVERIFLETDDSAISINDIYFLASELLNIPVIDLKLQLKQNLFSLIGVDSLE